MIQIRIPNFEIKQSFRYLQWILLDCLRLFGQFYFSSAIALSDFL